MITQDLGIATAYGYAKSKGYTGTEAEFAELMASYASTAQTAIEAADRAVEANTAAQSAKTDASASKTAAQTAAQTATTAASEANQSASTATTKASEANQSANTASAAATSAITSVQTATTAATTATAKASEAAASETAALSAKTDAESARDAAVQSASEAAASAESIDPETLEHKIYAAFATDTATGAIASFPDGADDIPMKDVLVHIEPVQVGSGDPSPDNIRPITGWTGAKVTRTGKNLILAKSGDRTAAGITFSVREDGSIVANGTATGTTWFASKITDQNLLTFLRAGTYTVTGGKSTNMVCYLGGEYVNGSDFPRNYDRGNGVTFTLTADAWVYPQIQIVQGQTCNNEVFNFQLSPGSTNTAYEPYSGQTYDITFPAEAGTVYGGTLDVTKGELVVDRAMVTKSASGFNTTSTAGHFFIDVAPSNSGTFVSYRENLSNIAINVNTSVLQANQMYVQSGFRVQLKTAYTSKDEFVSAMGDSLFEFCGKLVTPITYTLTPQEITSLLGTNNIWADTGDTEVEYRADAKLYIIKKITEAVSALS